MLPDVPMKEQLHEVHAGACGVHTLDRESGRCGEVVLDDRGGFLDTCHP